VTLPYNFWKEALKLDAESQGKLRQFHYLTDVVLNLFYERGCKPSVQSIIDDVAKVA